MCSWTDADSWSASTTATIVSQEQITCATPEGPTISCVEKAKRTQFKITGANADQRPCSARSLLALLTLLTALSLLALLTLLTLDTALAALTLLVQVAAMLTLRRMTSCSMCGTEAATTLPISQWALTVSQRHAYKALQR